MVSGLAAVALSVRVERGSRDLHARRPVDRRIADDDPDGSPIRVRDRSCPNDPGYAGIFGIPLDNSGLELLLFSPTTVASSAARS